MLGSRKETGEVGNVCHILIVHIQSVPDLHIVQICVSPLSLPQGRGTEGGRGAKILSYYKMAR